jgi:hypothetical protein
MKNIYWLPLFALLIWACSKPSIEPVPEAAPATLPDASIPAEKPKNVASIHQLQIGMPSDSVKALLGEPSKIDTVSRKPEKMEWWYGNDQKVEIRKGQVDRLTVDIAKEQDMLKQLMEAGKDRNDAEVNRLMEELTKGEK